ncbi:MAG: GTP-sensing pleiotropic transcriptional regulator CodY [Lachnospira sp.]
MSVQLLDKTRKINKLLHNNHSVRVEFNDICGVLSTILESNILVISKKGKILGTGFFEGVDVLSELINVTPGKDSYDFVGGFVDSMLNERFLNVLSTKENLNLATLGFTGDNVRKFEGLLAPIDIAGERLGTLFMYKNGSSYEIEDIILCEYGTTVVGLEMMRSVNEENKEEIRKQKAVKSALATLSSTELTAVISIFKELDGNDGLIVASKVADKVGITRSVIVNALKKIDSAGIIESRSSGMKGTHIKVINDAVFNELDRYEA